VLKGYLQVRMEKKNDGGDGEENIEGLGSSELEEN